MNTVANKSIDYQTEVLEGEVCMLCRVNIILLTK
jgi:hypothetical protein